MPGFPGNAGFPSIGGIPNVVLCALFPLLCSNNGSEGGGTLPFFGFPIATIFVTANGSAPQALQSPQQQAQQPHQQPPFDTCHEYIKIGEGLGATAALNELGAFLAGEGTPVAGYFHAMAVGEGVAAGILVVYGDVFCTN
jgi:hypothetical protein